jgi:DNA repair exonuclease SbcCD nuclease subunit
MSELVQVACIGDTHLQSTHWRNADRIRAFAEAIDAASKLPQLAAIVHMGDVFHTTSTPEDRLAVADLVQRAADLAPFLEVEGNHGRQKDTNIYARLRSKHEIRVVTAPEIVRLGGVSFAVLPYPSKAAMVAAGATREAQVQISHDAFDLMAMVDGAAFERESGPKMVVGHLTIRGAVTSVGQPLVAVELEMDPTTLARYGDCPKVFGHIHKHQVVGDAVYVGSSCRMDWGETERKGWLLVEFRNDRAATPWRHSWKFNELAIPAMYHVQGTLTRDAFLWEVRKGPDGATDEPPTARYIRAVKPTHGELAGDLLSIACDFVESEQVVDWTGCDVRVRAKYPQSERAVIGDARARIAALFQNARHLEIEISAVPDRQLRAPEVAAAVTVDEKLKAMARLDGSEWSGEIARCTALLMSTEDGDAVVADVEARLKPLASMEQNS